MLTYGDGVADVDLRGLLAFHRAHGKLATVTAVRPPARFGGLDLRRRPGRASSPRSRRSARAGSTAASSCSSRASSTTSTATTTQSRGATPLERLAARRPADGLPARRLLAVHGHAARQAPARDALGRRATRPGRCGHDAADVLARPPDARDRRHRPGRRLARAAARRAPAPTSSAWCATGCRRASWCAAARSTRVTRRARRRPRPGAARARPRRVRDRHRHPPGRPDDRRHRQPQPALHVRDQHRAAPGRCSRPAAAARAVQQIVVASSDKAYGDHDSAALRRGRRRCRAGTPTTSASRAPT